MKISRSKRQLFCPNLEIGDTVVIRRSASQKACEEERITRRYKVLEIFPDFALCEIIHPLAKYRRSIDHFEIFDRGKVVKCN